MRPDMERDVLSGRVVVFDVGKSLAKLSLWDRQGQLLAQHSRPNRPVVVDGRRALDTDGIEAWCAETLRDFARSGAIAAIVPVGHGAAAAIVRDGRLAVAVPDYEEELPVALRTEYERRRDPFALTGSPALPAGLNLGAQLFRLQRENPELFTGDARILPWPQYWGWRFSGVMASEVSSLGCHSDLWQPAAQQPSPLAHECGWATRLAPLRRADEVLGTMTAEWRTRSGLGADVQVHCGLHDSNAALLAARGYDELAGREATVLSTGTWFVAMRTPGRNAHIDLTALPEQRDCLVNVDVEGRAIPSARFMGGREIELLGGLDDSSDPVAALRAVIDADVQLLPGWVPDVGPYPHCRGHWHNEPQNPQLRRAAVALYAALMVDTLLDLIGTRDRLLIEGRFARASAFVSALATLRPELQVLVHGGDEGGVPYGALRLIEPALPAPGTLARIAPLPLELDDYRARWRRAAKIKGRAAEMKGSTAEMEEKR